MPLYYAGFNATSLFPEVGDMAITIDRFTEIPLSGITDMIISWNYFLILQDTKLYITGIVNDAGNNDADKVENLRLLRIPEESSISKSAAAGKESIVILTTNNDIWQYKVYEDSWRKIPNFMSKDEDSDVEYPVKVCQGGCSVILTNLGRVYNVPLLVDMPKRIKFVDVACGFDHTILLAENGDVYSMGMGTYVLSQTRRGQLGHNDLEDCDNPRLIKALAGLNVVQISAGGWHSAAVTDQGDLYTWGWNTNGELGTVDESNKVVAVPTLVDFQDDEGQSVEINVTKAQCGNTFTICLAEDRSLWGCGSNKYGQLGQPRGIFNDSKRFVKLSVNIGAASIKDFKCQEWGTLVSTDFTFT